MLRNTLLTFGQFTVIYRSKNVRVNADWLNDHLVTYSVFTG